MIGVEESKWSLTDLATFSQISQCESDDVLVTGKFHPDGLLYAAASASTAYLYDIKTSLVASAFAHVGLKSVAFSENGYHFATASPTTVKFWDLRKSDVFYAMEGLEDVSGIRFDGSGKYVGVSQGSKLAYVLSVCCF